MKEIGEYLKNRRLELGISLEDAEQYLKIRKKYLIAIENGDESVLPGKTYFLGYLRNYASYLGVDQEYLNQLLQNNVQSYRKTTVEAELRTKRKGSRYFVPEKKKPKAVKKNNGTNYFKYIKMLLIVGLLISITFAVNQFFNDKKETPVNVSQNENISNENSIEEKNDKSLEEELIKMAEENVQTIEETETEQNKLFEPLPDYKPVIINAQEPGWIKIIQDDEIIFENFIFSQEEIIVRAYKNITLWTTNKNIQVIFDDKEIEAQPDRLYNLLRFQIDVGNMNGNI